MSKDLVAGDAAVMTGRLVWHFIYPSSPDESSVVSTPSYYDLYSFLNVLAEYLLLPIPFLGVYFVYLWLRFYGWLIGWYVRSLFSVQFIKTFILNSLIKLFKIWRI